MNKLKYLYLSIALLLGGMAFTACSDSDEPDINQDPVQMQDYHFDLWVALGRHGGMGRDVQTLVRSMDNLDANQPTITFVGEGTEVNRVLSMETICKGAYYYQVPVSGDCFAKYMIKDNHITTVAERRFQTNTYSTRKYTHAWTDDKTLVIMAAAGDAKSIVWTKLNADNMTIISEGTLDVSAEENEIFTTSGILAYREQDNKLFYFYYTKTGGSRGKRTSTVQTAVINPATMAVEEINPCFMDCEMVGSAYGELLQTITFTDNSGNLYLACFSEDESEAEHSHLLRIPAGQTKFDPSYDGFTADGKLISVMYLGGSTVVAYARNDAEGTSIDSFSHYYTLINVETKTHTPITYNGVRLGYSSGRFSSRMAHVNGKAYIGVDEDGKNPVIYIYDAATGSVEKGAEMEPGYYFEQIRVIENI